MKRRIIGFETDEHGDWRAALECGHFQHVRHDPPLSTREWVLTEVGRESRIGFELDCKRCDDEVEPESVVKEPPSLNCVEFRDRYEILAVNSVKPFKTPTEIIGTVIADSFCIAVFCGWVAEHPLIEYDE